MTAIQKSSGPRERNAGSIPIERAFLRVFQTITKKLILTSAPLDALKEQMLDALVQASTAKCVEFNIAANSTRKQSGPAFLLIATLRGICEDLIYLTYLSRLEKRRADELISHLLRQNQAKALVAQKNFFDANNPTQPLLGAGLSVVHETRYELRAFWRSIGSTKRDGPTVRDLAEEVGLRSTYEYIYFASSNFVHFNPQSLLRTGWGPELGPFSFSLQNMNTYYRAFGSFYGAVLFIGFKPHLEENILSVVWILRLRDLLNSLIISNGGRRL